MLVHLGQAALLGNRAPRDLANRSFGFLRYSPTGRGAHALRLPLRRFERVYYLIDLRRIHDGFPRQTAATARDWVGLAGAVPLI